ncbi:hypothetical protein [Marinobacter sp. S6332]|uniref:hypothetical protein n=1 Tax=Marinobacter sp. S6332 TaxID=2926403 RepID=UPI001FF21931|nr:hypothetical protein [Marinobacter sp. S6332]MCK0163798.1 hypothetical protein [Marinobacter sp. S6332]
MHELRATYSRIKDLLGDNIEPLESVELVEAYRRFFKPETVRVVLLAESHVYTSDSERQIPVLPTPSLSGYPDQYARFVYCLGYGEKSLTKSVNHPKRDGTPQFWKIFYSCCNPISSPDDFRPILGKTAPEERLRNKIEILKQMKREGIWLIDASIVALYKDGQKMPRMFDALKESWQSYTRDVVLSAKPDHVICIGKGVASVVEPDLKKHFASKYTVLAQPNAFLSSAEHFANYQTYSRICGIQTSRK